MTNKEEKNEYARKWYAANKERLGVKEKLRVKTQEQKDNHNKNSRAYYSRNKEKHLALTRKRKAEIRALRPAKQLIMKFIPEKKPHILLTPEERKQHSILSDKKKYLKRKPIIQQRNKENREIINKKYREHIAKKCQIDPVFKLQRRIPGLIRVSIKRRGYSKKSKTFSILGCTWEELKNHIESKFEPWMNWGNWGKYNGEQGYGWDIDHIIPVSFGKTEFEIIRLNHFTNLQPLDSYVNRHIKRNKVA